MDVKSDDYKYLIENEKYVLNLKTTYLEIKHGINHMHEWVTSEIIPYDGETPLRGHSTEQKNEKIIFSKLFIYPTYYNWCKRNGIMPYKKNKFSRIFIENCVDLKVLVEKIRKNNGFNLKKICVDFKIKNMLILRF